MGAVAIPAVQIFSNPAVRTGLIALATIAVVSSGVKVAQENSGSKNDNEEPCCCEYKRDKNAYYRNHFIFKSSKKEAKEAALHYRGARGVMHHAHNSKDNYPHYHPTIDPAGLIKIPGVHFQYPR